eukprot:365190-Chlamydomonas_euryale.AAC.16
MEGRGRPGGKEGGGAPAQPEQPTWNSSGDGQPAWNSSTACSSPHDREQIAINPTAVNGRQPPNQSPSGSPTKTNHHPPFPQLNPGFRV